MESVKAFDKDRDFDKQIKWRFNKTSLTFVLHMRYAYKLLFNSQPHVSTQSKKTWLDMLPVPIGLQLEVQIKRADYSLVHDPYSLCESRYGD